MRKHKEKEVRIIGYITNEVRDYHAPVPENFMSNEKHLPQGLIEEFKKNGWQDSQGVVWWRTDFRPDPVRGMDGNVYLCVSDTDTSTLAQFFDRMTKAKAMLST